ncbi:ester cyclase [Nonomuraea sp. NN258]|uniref:ester cyclase n=1 Tax=Nonomuraea antri TaxID=2730852 RepID=UPI00156975BD|nr:ester cyclase [Nonomuraea antri]NRQ40366.1 ester cyclase [Nonomuraea antri]
MSADQEARNKTAFIGFHDALNTGDLDAITKAIDDVVHPDVIFHAPAPIDASGRQAMKNVWAVLLRAFPDIHVSTEDMIAEGDKVVFRNTVTGTHLGEYRGLPPTGRSVTYNEIFVVRFSDGLVAEVWGVVDVLAQLRQLGALPAVAS